MKNKKIPLLVPIVSFLSGVILAVLLCFFYVNFTYERFENFWIPTIRSKYFSSNLTNASIFLSDHFSNGVECERSEIDVFLNKINSTLANTGEKECEKFVLPNGTAYFIKNILDSGHLFFIAHNGDEELLLWVDAEYPGNSMWVKANEYGELLILQEGYNNPAKTLFLRPR